jgi:hypothetical protein
MRTDEKYYDIYALKYTLDAFEEFISNFPGHVSAEKAAEMAGLYHGNLYDFTAAKYIKTTVTGKSVKEMSVNIINNINSSIILDVPLGTYFAANNGYVQNMIAIKETTFRMKALEEITLTIDVACMNIYKDEPSPDYFFSVQTLDSESEPKSENENEQEQEQEQNSALLEILKYLEKNNATYALNQAAIWYYLDNPGKEKILNELEYSDGIKAITAEDYDAAVNIVENVLKPR